jgi:hypothetical protein
MRLNGENEARVLLVALVALLGASHAAAQEPERVPGPNGLAGWKITHVLENGNEVAETLVIARHGRRIREIHGDPFIWRWLFRDDGRIAYESGPLHFSMSCVLIDAASGREVERVDCFNYPDKPPAGGWPSWLATLEDSP